ncbi:MAG: hypothetical protein ACKO5V_04620, partial [Actinomycetota bacterium]
PQLTRLRPLALMFYPCRMQTSRTHMTMNASRAHRRWATHWSAVSGYNFYFATKKTADGFGTWSSIE